MHKIHTLHFPLEHVLDGMASAPLPPPSPDFLTGMGRTNDAILFGGHAHVFVTGSDEDSNTLLQGYNELNDWLIFNYEREAQIGNFFLWRRKTN